MKSIALLIILLLVFNQSIATGSAVEKPKIAVINEIVGLIVKEVVGEQFNVFSILPPNTDPHSFSLTPDIVSQIQGSILIVLIDPENFEIEKSIITNDMLKNIPYLCVKNYTNYGWEYHSIPGLETNFHGSWIYPKNALAIAKSVAEYLSQRDPNLRDYIQANVGRFQKEVNATLVDIQNIEELSTLSKLRALVMVPGVAYIVEAANIEVGDTVLVEPGAFPSASRLSELEGLLEKGEFNVIVVPMEGKGNRVDQLAKQLSQESGVPIAYVLTFSSGGLSSYESLVKFDAFSILSAINNVGQIEHSDGVISSSYCYLTIGILAIVVVVQAYIIFLYRRRELEGIEVE